MDFYVEQNDFHKAVSSLQSVLQSRSTMPILEHILLTTDYGNGKLQLTATNLESMTTVSIPADVQVDGSIAVQGKRLNDLLKEMKDGTLRLKLMTGDKCVITQGKSRFTLLSLPADEFPEYLIDNEAVELNIGAFQLLKLINQTVGFTTTDATRFALYGCLMELTGNQCRFVATDTHRLALSDAIIKYEAETPITAIIPRQALLQIKTLIKGITDNKDIEVCLTKSHLKLTHNNTVYTTKLVHGRYPNYQKVLPNNNASFTVNASALREACKRINVLGSEKSHSFSAVITPQVMMLKSTNPETEIGEEEVEIEGHGFDQIGVGFNTKYMLEMLDAANATTLKFSVKNEESPVLIEDVDNAQCKFVLMPVRV